jgi:hypothetical protein
MVLEVPRLEGWLTFPEAAGMPGVSNQGLHKMVFEARRFRVDDVRAVGTRPTFLWRAAAVNAEKAVRVERTAERETGH